MIWNGEKFEIIEHEISAYSISLRCKMIGGLRDWIFLGVYSPVLWGEVEDFLKELDDVMARWDLPWCIEGDSNLVCFAHKRKGEGSKDHKLDRFDEFVDRWSLIDGPLKGAYMVQLWG